MQKMESKHLTDVEEIQNDNDKKLYAQASDYLNLEQSKLEMKKMYDKKIKDLQDQNKKSIEQLLAEFKINLDKV